MAASRPAGRGLSRLEAATVRVEREDVRESPADHAEGATDAPGPRRIRKRRGHVLDVHVEVLHPSDALEVMLDLVHRQLGEGGATVAEELVGDQDVLRHLDGVLEQAVDVDHVHADELLPALDRLGGDVADVRDELQLQVAGLRAAPAGAHVELDRADAPRGRRDAWRRPHG